MLRRDLDSETVAALDDARAEIERLKEAWSGDIAVLKTDRDRAVGLLREAVVAERIDSDMLGHAALAGDSALGAWFALSVDPFLAELDGDPYFASPR